MNPSQTNDLLLVLTSTLATLISNHILANPVIEAQHQPIGRFADAPPQAPIAIPPPSSTLARETLLQPPLRRQLLEATQTKPGMESKILGKRKGREAEGREDPGRKDSRILKKAHVDTRGKARQPPFPAELGSKALRTVVVEDNNDNDDSDNPERVKSKSEVVAAGNNRPLSDIQASKRRVHSQENEWPPIGGKNPCVECITTNLPCEGPPGKSSPAKLAGGLLIPIPTSEWKNSRRCERCIRKKRKCASPAMMAWEAERDKLEEAEAPVPKATAMSTRSRYILRTDMGAGVSQLGAQVTELGKRFDRMEELLARSVSINARWQSEDDDLGRVAVSTSASDTMSTAQQQKKIKRG